MTPLAWQFWINRGGAFTDAAARDPEGRLPVQEPLSDGLARCRGKAVAGFGATGVPEGGMAIPPIDATKMGARPELSNNLIMSICGRLAGRRRPFSRPMRGVGITFGRQLPPRAGRGGARVPGPDMPGRGRRGEVAV